LKETGWGGGAKAEAGERKEKECRHSHRGRGGKLKRCDGVGTGGGAKGIRAACGGFIGKKGDRGGRDERVSWGGEIRKCN